MSEDHFSLVPEEFLAVPASASFLCTILICDIRGFTRLLETIPPDKAFEFIENFLYQLTSAVVKEGGSVNNLTGDGFLAQFGIGLFDQSHPLRAVNCAIEMRGLLKKLNLQRHAANESTFTIGIGLHTGQVAGGYLKLGNYSSFLIIGDTVNVAARIETLTKEFSVDILLSSETFTLVKNTFQFFPMPPKQVKGKAERIITYWIPPHAKINRNYPLENSS